MEGMRRRASCVRARSTPGRRAQATLEFAFVAPLFLLCFLAAVDAGLWALQSTAAVAAVESAARDAASAGAGPLSSTAPDARAVTSFIAGRVQGALFATRVVPWCAPGPGACGARACPRTPADVEAVFGPRVVAVCVEEKDPPRCATAAGGVRAPYPPYCTDTPLVTVRITGYIAALVPPGFGPGAQGGELPTDLAATTHTLRFAP
ncbi:MAG: pilus assembly protein [Candidatus Dormibacteraeota bacterium]|nr:pilus assembly protein [Candidatus Dormibacteraeota bacterium]MBV9526658.1 pilus assembly protein [Candidatus Dormibacteraeota bacterium]